MRQTIKTLFTYALALPLTVGVGGVMLTGCADDHFDVSSEVTGRLTIWQQIESDPQLSEFASILKRINYSKSEGSVTSQSYADMLNHDQTFTLWIPANGTFDYAKYDSLITKGTTESLYKVEKELVRNSMVRYSHVLNGTESTQLELFNDKTAIFDCANSTMGGKSITRSNIGCSNGVVHVLDGAMDYMPNLYEFLASRSDLDSINQFYKAYEKLEFDENSSTQGPTVGGNITWVDSVTNVQNEYFYSTNAYLNREDSLYAMVIPTNTAWEKVLKQTSKYYNYMDTYTQTIYTADAEDSNTKETYTTVFTEAELDSMKNLYSKNAICEDLTFNARYQYTPFNASNPADCDSLKTTSMTIIRAPYIEPIFKGTEAVTLSNGYAYVADELNYRPADGWAKKKLYEAEQGRNVETYTLCEMVNYTGSFERNDSVIKYTVAKAMQSSSSSQPTVTFKLQNTLSCDYDIYLLMAYNENAQKPCKFKTTITYHDGTKAKTTSKNLTPVEGDTLHTGPSGTFISRTPYIDDNGYYQQVDTIPLAKDFSLPVCYQGIDNAYVTLKISCNVSSKEVADYTREMWFDKIILVAKEAKEQE